MTEACPLCDRSRMFAACACGYDFKTRDPEPAFARVGQLQRRYHAIWQWGLFTTLVGFVGMVAGMTLDLLWLFAIAELPTIAGVSVTIYCAGADVVVSRRQRQMKRRLALPVARLL